MDKPIGMAEIAFSMAPVREKINRNRVIFIEILVFQLLAGAVFSFLMNLQIIKPLRYLSRTLAEAPPETDAHVIAVPAFSSAEIRGMIGSVNEMRERLVAYRKETVEKARFATMGKIAASMAHEIRNPLEAISGAVELMEGGGASGAEAAEYLSIIREEIRNLDAYLGEFLEFARPEPHVPKPADLNELLRETLLLLTPLAKKRGIALELSLAPEPLVCRVDGNRLKRVFLNVALNGIEACSAGGRVTIESGRWRGSLIVTVRDDGPGISDELTARVFEPYFTTKEGGSGIGLSLSKSIVEQHGGSIGIAGGPGTGAVVTIAFPEEGVHG
jgi:signal transduction histidine kinase